MKFAIQNSEISNVQIWRMLDVLKPEECFTFGIIPYSLERKIPDEYLNTDELIIPFGSVQIARDKEKYPINWFICHNYNFNQSQFRFALEKYYLNHDCKIMFYHDLKGKSYTNDIFVKPDGDLKQFNGGILKAHNKIEDTFNIDRTIKEDFLITCARVKNIEGEFRCWVVNKEIIEVVPINRTNFLLTEQQMQEIDYLVKYFQPHDNFVVDFCLYNGKIKVVEYNCINCSGFTKSTNVRRIFDAFYA